MAHVNTKCTKNHQNAWPLYSDNSGFLGNERVLNGRNAGYGIVIGFRLHEMRKPPLLWRFCVGVIPA